jgi:DNA-binding IclR family transcriptional regulator
MSEREVTRCLKPELLVTVTPKTETDPDKIRLLLRKALKDGFVEVLDTNVEGASGVSAPIFGPTGKVIGGLNLGAPTTRYKKNRLGLITLVCHGAAAISASFTSSVTSNT